MPTPDQGRAITPAFEALAAHFDRPDRRESGEQVAHNAIAVLLRLPVEQRMEAMGMRKATWDDIDTDLRSPVWVEAR